MSTAVVKKEIKTVTRRRRYCCVFRSFAAITPPSRNDGRYFILLFFMDFTINRLRDHITWADLPVTKLLNLFLSDKSLRVTERNIEFEIDLKQFFQYYRVINSKYLAKRIGMNESLISQHVKGRKKPSPGQTSKILSGIQEIGRELSNIHSFTNWNLRMGQKA